MMRAALAADGIGLEKLALRGAGVVFGMEYFRGVREESGSLGNAIESLSKFVANAADAPRPLPGVPRILSSALKALHR
jgi:hypothetical protein